MPQSLPWYRSFWSGFLSLFGVHDKPAPQEYSAGTDYAGHPTQGFPPLPAKETMAEFGWVYAAETAIASDLAALPWRMSRKRPGEKAEVVTDHPFLRLLDNPSPRTPAVLIEQQLWLDLLLTGKCCGLLTWAGEQPIGIVHLPSDRVETIASRAGELDARRPRGATGESETAEGGDKEKGLHGSALPLRGVCLHVGWERGPLRFHFGGP